MTTYTRIELLGYIAEQVFEYALDLKDDTLVANPNAVIPHEPNCMKELKDAHGAGDHAGDCTKLPCSCLACAFADMIETGNRIALCLIRSPGDVPALAKALNGGKDPNESWTLDWARLTLREIQKHGLMTTNDTNQPNP